MHVLAATKVKEPSNLIQHGDDKAYALPLLELFPQV